jgi:hypothetical protein
MANRSARQTLPTPARKLEDARLADYDNGFQAQIDGAGFSFDQPLDWRRGWLEADTAEDSQMGGTL